MSIKIGHHLHIGNTLWRRGGGAAAPDAPTNLAATVYDDDRIDLTWDAVVGADSYKIYYGTDGITFGSSTTSATNSKSVTGLISGTLYYFYAIAIKGSLESTASNIDSDITYTPEYITYVTGLITPLSSGQATRINTFIATLKSGLSITNLSDAFDIMYILAGETEESSLKNLISNAYHCTNVSEMAFTALEGFTGDGAADYLNTGYKLKSNGIKAVLNSTSLGVYSRDDLIVNGTDIGARTGSADNRTFLQIKNASSYVWLYINTDIATSGNKLSTTSLGMFIGSRTASNLTSYFRNNLIFSTVSHASNDLPNYDLYISALNDADTPTTFSTRQLSFAFVGKGFDSAQMEVITNAFENYMDISGKGAAPFNLGILDSTGYCWFVHPKAIYNAISNKTWMNVVHEDSSGFTQHIVTIDNDTDVVTTAKVGTVYQTEDHNEGSILVRASDSKLFTCYCEHSLSTNIRYRLSTNALDASAWEAENTVAGSGLVSYSSCFQSSNGNIYIFYREANNGWCYIKSTDGGVSFGVRVNIFYKIDSDGYGGYLIPAQSPVDSDIIHFIGSTGHPALSTTAIDIIAFYFDCATDKFYKLDGTETTANLPFDALSDVTVITNNTLDDTGWINDIIVDINGNPRYLFTKLPDGKNGGINCLTKELYYSEWTGLALTTPYKIHTALEGYVNDSQVYDAGTGAYPPNACFNVSNPNIIISSKEVDGVLELYKITRVASDNFTSVAITTNSKYNKWRPFTVACNVNNLFYLNKKRYPYYTGFSQTLGMTTMP